MQGEINYAHKTASLNVWVDGIKYRLIADEPDVAKAKQKAEQIAQTIVTRDWSTMYHALSDEIAGTLTEEEFTQAMTTSPHVLGATIAGNGTPYELSGYHYFSIDVQLAVQEPGGSVQYYSSTEFLIIEQGEWRLITTTTPEPI